MTEQGGIGRDGMGQDRIEKNWIDVDGVRRDVDWRRGEGDLAV